jgi:hypothetical protein
MPSYHYQDQGVKKNAEHKQVATQGTNEEE